MERQRGSTGERVGFRIIWALAWPQILMMFLTFCIGFVDVYVGGRIDRETQAAIGVLSQAMFFFQVVAAAVANGAVARSASPRVPAGTCGPTAMSGCACCWGGGLGRDFVCRAGRARSVFAPAPGAGAHAADLPLFHDRVFVAAAIQSFFFIANALFRARRLVMVPLFAWGIAAVLNAGGDFGFGLGAVGLPKLGYVGVAWSTFLSVTAGMVFNLLALCRAGMLKPAQFPPWRWMRCGSRFLIRVAWPSGLMQIVWHTGYLVLFAITGSLPSGSLDALPACQPACGWSRSCFCRPWPSISRPRSWSAICLAPAGPARPSAWATGCCAWAWSR
jgi:MATE family multidrug resistance protein